ncbi:MAG: deoxyribodipyrimidine photo-lyase, partial [Pseudomonadota bacterium]
MNASSPPPALVWLRRDLRLDDHPALTAAAAAGPVIPVFILDPQTEALGAAHLFRLERSLERLAAAFRARNARLILRRGEALATLRALIEETGARAVHWSRLHDRAARERDTAVKAGLKEDGVEATSHPGHLLFEPWTVETGSGGFYKVYTPYWKSVSERVVHEPLEAPSLRLPEAWPQSLELSELGLSRRMNRGAEVVGRFVEAGEEAARAKLETFLEARVRVYPAERDRPDLRATSGMSDHLALGEISPRRIWSEC